MNSYNGWPASKDQAEIGIKAYKVEGTNLKLRCAEKVAPLLINFAKEFNELIEPIEGGTFEASKVPMIRALAKKYGLTWGGDYKNRKDEMHFEISIGPPKVAELITKLGLEKSE